MKRQFVVDLTKFLTVYTLFFLLILIHSCQGQNKSDLPKETIISETIDTLTSNIWDITQDRNGNIWFAASDGVFRYDGKSFTKVTREIVSEPFFSVFEDSKGNFWFGTYGSGVFYYDGKSFRNFTTKDGLANNSVMPVYEDKTGIIWLGTAGGLSCYDGKSFKRFTTTDGMTNNDVHAIVQDKTGKIWVGTRGDLTVYDGKKFATVTDKDGKTFRNVWAIIKDKTGNIWFGADGLWRYDGSDFTKIDQTGAGVIIEDVKGSVLTSIGGSILRYDAQSLSDKNPRVTEIKTEYEGRRNLPFGLLAANDGSIWVGSERYNIDGDTLTNVKGAAGR